jgi:hypothetical protein
MVMWQNISVRARKSVAWSLLGAAAISAGCSATPVGMAMNIAGEAVNDVDEQEKAKQYVGAPVSEADAKLGQPVDVYTATRANREWRVYPVPMDPLNNARYVIEVKGGQILGVEKVQRTSDPVIYAGTLAVIEPKVKGKSPSGCEAGLGAGPPLLTVRSRNSGNLVQLYDARVVKEVEGPHFYVLWFDADNTCEKVDVVKGYTASGQAGTLQ